MMQILQISLHIMKALNEPRYKRLIEYINMVAASNDKDAVDSYFMIKLPYISTHYVSYVK